MSKNKTIKFIFPDDVACPDSKYVRLWVNGKLIEIERGKEVEVPEEYVEIYKKSLESRAKISKNNDHISNDDTIRTTL